MLSDFLVARTFNRKKGEFQELRSELTHLPENIFGLLKPQEAMNLLVNRGALLSSFLHAAG
jgi:hypothetical protein